MVHRAMQEHRPYPTAFVDMRMPPGWDGLETINRIWQLDPDLQVIICTAYSDYSLETIIEKLGHSDRFVILRKPFDVVEVQQLANAMTEKWRLLRQTRTQMENLEQTVSCRNEQLDQSHAENETLLASITAAIIGLDQHGRVLRWNRAAELLFNRRTAEVIGHPLYECGLHLDWTSIRQAIQLCSVARETIELHNLPYRRADGRDGLLDLSLTPNRSDFNHRLNLVILASDITQRHALETQLRQAQKLEAIGQLAAGIAHEINTPTQYVGDNTRFLKDSFESIANILRSHEQLLAAAKTGTLSPALLTNADATLAANDLKYLFDQIPTAIRETLEGIERISRIVRAMKEFSHPGTKEKVAADLNKAIESTTTVARNEWKYVADLELDLDPQLPLVPCLIGEFNQCILNLVVNSSHAIADVLKEKLGTKGLITVSTRLDGDHVEVRVADTGTGIPEAVRPRIFEPFFTTKEVGKGTGQGLSIVYGSIVRKHGGTVRFETETGKGTTFILRIPLKPAGEKSESDPARHS